ncbi:MAG TPA: methyltransferase domain-containing protein [Actinomycetota bacterium]
MTRADNEQISSRYDDERGGRDVPREELVTQALAERPAGIRLLDVGCGTGNYLAAQQRRFARLPVTFIGLDPSHGMLSVARAPSSARDG